MSDVLTTAARLQCPHQGPIVVSAHAALTVGGVSVFAADDLLAATVSCPAGQSKCSAVASVASGTSGVLFVGGQPVVLASLSAQTDRGTIALVPGPPSPLSAA